MSGPLTIPLTILGGYLGAGKTTLINRLLAGTHGKRVTILVNDFGAINIDASQIAAHGGDTIALSNGCACCQLQDDVLAQLTDLVTRPHRPGHIIIEASGAGEPARLAYLGYGIEGLALSGIYVAVDATTLADKRRDKFVGRLISRQIEQADQLWLTKTDLIGNNAMAAEKLLCEISHAPINIAATSPVERLLEHMPVNPTTSQNNNIANRTPDAPIETETAAALFEQISFTSPTALPVNALDALLNQFAGKLARAKGHTGDHRLQLVDKRWTLIPADRQAARLVFIAPKGACNLSDLQKKLHELVGPAGLEPATKPL